jgi:hypothetical protein
MFSHKPPYNPLETIREEPRVGFTDKQIKYMVDRFLRWRLPNTFHPDGGIYCINTPSFDPPLTGTNLLNAQQAEIMIRTLVFGVENE